MKKLCFHLFLFCSLFLLTLNPLSAQREQTLMGGTGFRFSGVWGGVGLVHGLGQGRDKSVGYASSIWALEFGKRFYIGGLHYGLDTDIWHDPRSPFGFRAPRLNATTSIERLQSNNLLLGYSFLSYRPIHPIFTVAVGATEIELKTDSRYTTDFLFALQPSAGFQINIARWLHVDAQVGYRAHFDSHFAGFTDKDFSEFFGQVNFKFGFSWGRYKKTIEKEPRY
jgi:hypothetical protein